MHYFFNLPKEKVCSTVAECGSHRGQTTTLFEASDVSSMQSMKLSCRKTSMIFESVQNFFGFLLNSTIFGC